MKKTLSLILAVIMLLGAFSITAFATTDNSTDITLTVAKALTYEMVIPEDVTDLNAAGIYSVGQAKVANVKNATDNTVISYTAETTAFKSEGKTDIPASYYTDAQGTTAFPTTAVEVYKSKADAASIPTMYVGISESAWDAAENGTYTATVTYNFSAEETPAMPATMLISNILATAEGGFPTENDDSAWVSETGAKCWGNYYDVPQYTGFGILSFKKDGKFENSDATEEATWQDGNYVYVRNSTRTLTFVMENGKLTAITFDNSSEEAVGDPLYSTYYPPTVD